MCCSEHDLVLNNTCRTAQVSPFLITYDALENVPIVDAAIAHDSDITGKTYLLICQNALYFQSMDHNFIPPFIMREANVTVNKVPKIQNEDLDVTHHSIWFPDSKFFIPLSLREMFSYFLTRIPTREELLSSKDVLMLMPHSQTWN